MTRSSDIDPSRNVHEPIAKALDSVILVAAVSFAIFVLITVAAVMTPEGLLHEYAHVAMLVVMAAIVVGRGIHMWRNRGRPARTDVGNSGGVARRASTASMSCSFAC